MQIYHANIVYSKERNKLAVHESSYIAVENGIVEGIWEQLPEKYAGAPLTDYGNSVIIPAFSDLHVHAPQYPQRALGMDLLLADWLNTYTFPQEARYADPEYAAAVYEAFLKSLMENGTFHACVYGTIHREATSGLLERMEALKLRAYVGKVNMDIQSPEYLCETAEESLRETEIFLETCAGNKYAKPIITPRFAPTCSFELLKGLGKLGKKYQAGMQTHLVESRWEAGESVRLNPGCTCDTQIYEKAGLLENGPVIAAHFIFPGEDDIRILKQCGGYAVQCPDATVNVIAGIMQTAALADEGISLALGSDIAGGHLPGIYTQAARSVQLSKLKAFYEPEGNRSIPFESAFYMATKEGGALFGKVGSLEPGYEFDALVIRNFSDPFRAIRPEETLERFCYTGNPADILAGFIHGKAVIGMPDPSGKKR
jgi:guanine deaminase